MVHSVELLFDPGTESAIRRVWKGLIDAGLPSQAPTSRPHVTLVVAANIAPEVDALLVPVLDGLPFPCVVGAPMVFGRSPLTLVRLLVPSEDLLSLHAQVHRLCLPHLVPGPMDHTEPGRWTPHVTLARRVEPGQLPRALTMRRLGRDVEGSVVGLRRWDGNKRVEHLIG